MIYIHNTLGEAHSFITYRRTPRAGSTPADLPIHHCHKALTEQHRPRFFTRALHWSDWKPNNLLLTQYTHHTVAIGSYKSACGDHRATALDDDLNEMSGCGPHYLAEVICLYMVTNCTICTFFELFTDNTILHRFTVTLESL